MPMPLITPIKMIITLIIFDADDEDVADFRKWCYFSFNIYHFCRGRNIDESLFSDVAADDIFWLRR